MLGMEAILSELEREEMKEEEGGLPPGFRFHPTDEELITFYLASKVFNGTFCGVEIAEVDLNRCEPWELPDVAKMGEREWYFYSLRDRKYPTGLRTNRATGAGYWKATGKDREVYSSSGSNDLIGMKKTLVFYKGRAPRGHKTKWVMHEYRLDGHFSCRHSCKEEWVICRIFHKIGEKKIPAVFQGQSYLITTSSNSLPPLLEPTLLDSQSHQNPQIIQTLNPNFHIQTLINPLVSQSDLFSANNNNFPNPISSFTATNKDSIFFLPNQDLSFKELSNAITKHCKKESTSQLICDGFVNNNMQWDERVNQENCIKYQNSLLLSGLDCGGDMGNIPSAAAASGVANNNLTAAAIDHLMSTEPPAYTWW